jgi:hypothetical protein
MKKKEGIIFSLVLLCLVGAALISSFSYNLKTRLVPMIVGSISVVLSLVIVAGELFPRFRQVFEVDLFARDNMGASEHTQAKWDEKKGLIIAVSWLVVFAILLFLVGFNISIPIWVLVYVRFFGKQKWSLSLAVAAMLWVFIYGLFHLVMDYTLFEGVLFGGIV